MRNNKKAYKYKLSHIKSSLTLALFALICSSPSVAGTLQYFQSKFSGQVAELTHREIKENSQALQYLNCPIEMIERQWGGLQSVKVGIKYLQEYLLQSNTAQLDFADVNDRCQEDLETFRDEDRKGNIRARAIVGTELDNFQTSIASEQDQRIFQLVKGALNEETECSASRTAIEIGYLLTGSFGYYHMECISPLGRRFILSGPSLGAGFGVIAAVSLPNVKKYRPLNYRILLYKQQEKSWWRVQHFSYDLAAGLGISSEQDFDSRFRDQGDGLRYLHNLSASIGVGMTTEWIRNVMLKKDISPFYYRLSQAFDLNTMAKNASLTNKR